MAAYSPVRKSGDKAVNGLISTSQTSTMSKSSHTHATFNGSSHHYRTATDSDADTNSLVRANPNSKPKRRRSSLRNSTSSGSGSGTLGQKKPTVLRTNRHVLHTRLAFLTVLVLVAISLGFGAYQVISRAEEQAASVRFDSIAERALSVAQLVIEEKKKATDSLALMVGAANPNPEAWPYVHLEGYQEIASSLGIVTEGSLSFCPLVTPGGEEQESFEAFAYDLFHNQSGYANTTGVSAFGKGIFSYGSQDPITGEAWPDGRFHITSNYTYHRSPHSVLVPFLQSDFGPHPVLMLNVHFEHNRAAAIDSVIECSAERQASQDYTRECGSITDLMWSATKADVDPGPAGLMMVPIYPRKANTTLKGFIVGKQIWHDLLQHGFESDVSGLHVVLRTSSNTSHTYLVQDGQAVYLGGDDLHNPNASLSHVGTRINPRYFSNTTVAYYMDIYSTEEFTEAYMTDNPQTACFGAVFIILITTLLFVAYDYFVRREFQDKKKLLEAKRQFVRFVSHEVRTPLNTVCMGLTLLQHDFDSVLGIGNNNRSPQHQVVDTERVKEWTQLSQQVFSNANAAVQVLSDLLHYDKIQMGTLTLELTLLPIVSLLERTVNEFRIAAQEKGVEMEFEIAAGLINSEDESFRLQKLGRVVGDDVKLTQVFRNLISNGLKFSKERGTLTVRIVEKPSPQHKRKEETVKCGKDEQATVVRRGEICVQVVDDGVGMTEEQVNTVFDDGTQFNANKFQAGGGSGLGMSIAKGVVSAHGGQLTASSKGLGHGSCFAVTMPLYDASEEESEESTSVPTSNNSNIVENREAGTLVKEQSDTDYVIPKFYILVVDDALSNRKLCMRLLERNGHTCKGANDGKEAVEMVKKSMEDGKPYDCILMDYEMPIMNGPEACSRIRKMGCSSYVAGVTGNCMSEDVDHFRNCGANCVIPKPFKLATLEERWMEDDVTPFACDQDQEAEKTTIVRVSSTGKLVDLGDEVAMSLQTSDSTLDVPYPWVEC